MRRYLLVAACVAAVAAPAGVAFAGTSTQTDPTAPVESGPAPAFPQQPAGPVARAVRVETGDPVAEPPPPVADDGPCWDDYNPDAASLDEGDCGDVGDGGAEMEVGD